MGAYAAGAGAIIGGIGSIFGANEARKKKNQLTDLANTPGLDIDSEIANALGSDVKNLSGASTVAGGVNASNSAQMKALLEAGIPGYEGLSAQNLANIGSELRGELPPDVQAAIERATAGRALAGGYGGSEAARNLTSRDLGLTSLGLTQRGGTDLSRVLQTTPLPGLVGAQNFLGPSISDRIGIRSNERTQRLQMLSGSILAPSGMDVIANYLQKTGGALMGAGTTGGLGIGGSGGSGIAEAPTYYGSGNIGGTIQPYGGMYGTGE
jgi:hypothetical protein